MKTTTQRHVRKKLEELAEALPAGRRIMIVPHDYPDPDALASAAAMHLLLKKRYGLYSQIVFSGDVSRAENKELLRRFRYKWHRLSDLRVPRHNAYCIFVDTAPWLKNVTVPPYGRPIAVLDHHRHAHIRAAKGVYTDIRAGTGATTTLAYEYLQAAGIPIPRWLAAIMAYAIASETLDLSRDSDEADLKAYVELAARADLKIVGKIRHAPLPRAYFARLKEAIGNARKLDRLAWSHLQAIEQPEIVAEIADLLLRMEGIHWSFCTANMNGGMYISLRSKQRGAACSRLLRSVIGKDGSAGGHDQMAAGYLDMSRLPYRERQERKKLFQKALIRKIGRRFMRTTGELDDLIQPLVEKPAGRLTRRTD